MSHSEPTDWSQAFHEDEGAEAIRERVLADSAYLQTRDKIGNTPLLSAIGLGDLDLVKFLLDQGADPNCEVDDGYTCLLSAVEPEELDSLAIVEALIAAGADLHVYGINGWAPLHMAAARNRIDVAKSLLKAGANVNQRIQIDGHDSPLMEATRNGHADMVRLLLEQGADTEVRDMILDQGLIELAETAMKGADPDTIDELRKLPAINPAELLADMDLAAQDLEQMMAQIGEVDMVQNYIDGANELAEKGQHAEVIEILRNWKPSSAP